MIGALLGGVAAVVVVVAGVVERRRRARRELDKPEGGDQPAIETQTSPQTRDRRGEASGSPSAAGETPPEAGPEPPAKPGKPGSPRSSPPAEPRRRDTGPPAPAILAGPRVDGSTCLRISSSKWASTVAELRARVREGVKIAELADVGGGEVVVEIEMSGGELHVQRGEFCLAIRGRQARLEVRQGALERESMATWYAREVPRATQWLLGVELGGEAEEIAEQAQALGWRTRLLELACDVVGLPIEQVTAPAIVTKIQRKKDHWDGDVRTGITVGLRKDQELSVGVYDKLLELGRRRRERPAYLERLRQAGWVEGQAVTRVEARLQGDALRLGETGEGEGVDVDGTHAGAVFHRATLLRLWAYAMQQVWVADLSAGCQERKNYPPLPAWRVLQEVAGVDERLVRIAPGLEHTNLCEHADADLRRSAVRRSVLGGATTGAEARRASRVHLARVMVSAEIEQDVGRYRARYGGLLDELDGGDGGE